MDRQMVLQILIDAEIYDLELASKIAKAFSGEMPEIKPHTWYGLDIVFDRSVYQVHAFYQYPLSKKSLHPRGQEPKTEQDKATQIIYDVLSEQLDNVTGALEARGYKFGHVAIIGDNLEGNDIKVTLYEEGPIDIGKGKHQRPKTCSIMPDRPYVTEYGAKVMAKFILEQIRKESLRDIAKQQHAPNFVIADTLFAAIAREAVPGDSSAAMDLKDKLLVQAYIESNWPLKMRRRTQKDGAEHITPDTEIDCPEYMIFHQFVGGHWTLEEIKNLKEAQQYIIKKGYALKRTQSVTVLHNVSPVPYTLLQDTEDGLVMLTLDEARGQKNLRVIWNKRKAVD